MEARIYFYSSKNVAPKITTNMREKIFGKIQQSNYGRYEYEVKGMLKKSTYIRPVRATVIARQDAIQTLKEVFDQYGIKYRALDIIINQNEFNKKSFFG